MSNQVCFISSLATFTDTPALIKDIHNYLQYYVHYMYLATKYALIISAPPCSFERICVDGGAAARSVVYCELVLCVQLVK